MARETTPIQAGNWSSINDFLASVTKGSGLHRETLPIQAGDWAAVNDYLADIAVGSAVLRERLPIQPGNWSSLSEYLALIGTFGPGAPASWVPFSAAGSWNNPIPA